MFLAIFDVDSLGILILHFSVFSLHRCAFCHALFTIKWWWWWWYFSWQHQSPEFSAWLLDSWRKSSPLDHISQVHSSDSSTVLSFRCHLGRQWPRPSSDAAARKTPVFSESADSTSLKWMETHHTDWQNRLHWNKSLQSWTTFELNLEYIWGMTVGYHTKKMAGNQTGCHSFIRGG